MTAAAPRLGRDPALWATVLVLWALLGLFVLAFATAAVAGLMGAFITKAAPVL